MSTQPVRPRSFVMLMIGWCAVSAAPVAALSPPLAAAFFVLAMGLVAVAALRFAIVGATAVATAAAAAFVLVLAAGPVALTALSPDTLDRLLPGLAHPQTVAAALLGVLALAGAVAVGGLAAAGLEWDAIKREVAAAAVATGAAGPAAAAPEDSQAATTVLWRAPLTAADATGDATGETGEPDEPRPERGREEELEEQP